MIADACLFQRQGNMPRCGAAAGWHPAVYELAGWLVPAAWLAAGLRLASWIVFLRFFSFFSDFLSFSSFLFVFPWTYYVFLLDSFVLSSLARTFWIHSVTVKLLLHQVLQRAVDQTAVRARIRDSFGRTELHHQSRIRIQAARC